MKSVVFVHLYNDRSGSPKVLLQVIKALHVAGYNVEILTSKHKGGFLDEVPGKKKYIFYRRTENKLITLFLYLISQLILFFKCLAYAKKDVVFHINTVMPCGASLAAWVTGKKVVYHLHETSIKPELFKKILFYIIDKTATHVIYVSYYLSKVNWFNNAKEVVIRNALDFIPETNIEKNNKIYFNVLMACSLKKYKGVDEFIKLASVCYYSQCEEASKLRFTLVLNSENDYIDEYFSSKTITPNLNIFRRQSDLSCFYLTSDILLNLTRPDECIETFGLTILEGMAYGLPVIVPLEGGPVELVRNGKEGFHISCYDTSKIKKCIIDLSKDSAAYEAMSRNSRMRAVNFSPDSFSKKIVSFYNDEVIR